MLLHGLLSEQVASSASTNSSFSRTAARSPLIHATFAEVSTVRRCRGELTVGKEDTWVAEKEPWDPGPPAGSRSPAQVMEV